MDPLLVALLIWIPPTDRFSSPPLNPAATYAIALRLWIATSWVQTPVVRPYVGPCLHVTCNRRRRGVRVPISVHLRHGYRWTMRIGIMCSFQSPSPYSHPLFVLHILWTIYDMYAHICVYTPSLMIRPPMNKAVQLEFCLQQDELLNEAQNAIQNAV